MNEYSFIVEFDEMSENQINKFGNIYQKEILNFMFQKMTKTFTLNIQKMI